MKMQKSAKKCKINRGGGGSGLAGGLVGSKVGGSGYFSIRTTFLRHSLIYPHEYDEML